MKQTERIVDYCRRFGSITALEAMRDLGIYRLASRICDLKDEGYPIEREFVSVHNRFGEKTSIVRYKVKEKPAGA